MASTANSSACIFYDVVTGNNSVPCVAGSPNCSSTTSGSYGILEVNPPSNSTPAWTTGPGYDLATGLGSVNAANLVKNWSSISFQPSTTTLASLSPTTLTHGQAVNFTVNVAPGSGSGTLTGNVSLIAQTGVSSTNVTGIGPFPLSGGSVSSSTNMLPGGKYGVTAHYAGNGTYGASDSTPPVQVTVSPEASQTQMSFVTFNTTTGAVSGTSPTPPSPYGSAFYFLRVDVLNSAGQPCAPTTTSNGMTVQGALTSGCPTGTVALTENGNPLGDVNGSPPTLNSQGYVEDQSIAASPSLQPSAGTGTLIAEYSGDASFKASSQTLNYTIAKAPTTLTYVNLTPPSLIQYGDGVPGFAQVNSTSFGTYPGGTFTLFVDGAQYGNPVPADTVGEGNPFGSPPAYAYAESGSFSGPALSVGTHTLGAQYSGDSNYQGSTSANSSLTVLKNQPNVTVAANPQTINLGQQTTLTATVQGAYYGVAPTGTVSFSDGGAAISGTVA
jgi:hypothetical protein